MPTYGCHSESELLHKAMRLRQGRKLDRLTTIASGLSGKVDGDFMPSANIDDAKKALIEAHKSSIHYLIWIDDDNGWVFHNSSYDVEVTAVTLPLAIARGLVLDRWLCFYDGSKGNTPDPNGKLAKRRAALADS